MVAIHQLDEPVSYVWQESLFTKLGPARVPSRLTTVNMPSDIILDEIKMRNVGLQENVAPSYTCSSFVSPSGGVCSETVVETVL